MAYVYKKIISGKPYYYLRISKKVKDRVMVKDVAYLGNDASKIDSKIPKEYKKDIRKAYKNIKKFIQEEYYIKKVRKLKLKENIYLKKENFESIEAIKLHFNENFLKQNIATINEVYKNFLIDFAFNTTSIEGNTITLSETNKLLKENLTPKNRTLREIHDLKNTENVFFELINQKEEITLDFIEKLHDSLLENIDVRKGFRTHDVRVFKSHFEVTPFPYIKTDVHLLLNWYGKNKNKLHPLILAGIFHHKFEKIHPFSDGNGRTGRMLLNYILIAGKYPPLIVKKSKRSEYLDLMAQADKAGLTEIDPKYYKKLINYLSAELIESYWTNFNI